MTRAAKGLRPTMRVGLEGRHDRQRLAGWSPDTLEHARVVLVGAGAIGNEVLKNLVLIGVGTIAIIDFDLVAPSNLTRCVLMHESDVGQSKAEVVARRAMTLNPAVTVIPIHGDVEFDLGEAYLAEADVVIGCLDNAHARYVLNRRTRQVQRPWIDTAISHEAVQVSWIGAPGPCYACGLTDATMETIRTRLSCTGLKAPVKTPIVPTTVVTAALAGAFATDLAVNAMHGKTPPDSRRWSLFMRSSRWMEDSLSVGAECAFHDDPGIRELHPWRRRAVSTWAELAASLDLTPSAAVELPQPVVTGFSCGTCGEHLSRVGPKRSIPHAASICASCNMVMETSEELEVSRDGELAHVPLERLGVPAGSRLRITDQGRQFMVELPTDPRWAR